jgi:hypothetical protein
VYAESADESLATAHARASGAVVEAKRVKRVLFVTWDGPAQNYLVDLFLPILSRLQHPGLRFEILQFSSGDETVEPTRAAAAAAGIPYHHCATWRRPRALATVGMIGYGATLIRRLIRKGRVDVLMPRSAIPAAMCLLAGAGDPVRMLFDADGMMPDERVEFEGWSARGAPYRLLRLAETMAVRRAHAVVTRSGRARQIALERCGAGVDPGKLVVALNGRDPSMFHPGTPGSRAATRAGLCMESATPFVAYVGSLGAKYMPDRIFAFFGAVHRRRPDARLQILTGNQEIAHAHALRARIPRAAVDIRRLPGDEVPAYLAAADLGLAFISPGFSVQATAPTKIGEYLLCGTPSFATRWAGDTAEHLHAPGIGRLAQDLSDADLEEAAQWFVDEVLSARDAYRERCRQRGLEVFSLAHAVAQYRKALDLATATSASATGRGVHTQDDARRSHT